MALWEYLVLFIAVVISGGLAFLLKNGNRLFIQLTLSFSGAYLLGIAFLHLIPEAYAVMGHQAGYYVLGGFLMQLLLERLSKGIEHGHIHAAHSPRPSFVISIMLGLCIHAFFEGFPLETYTELGHEGHQHAHTSNHLLFGIIFHKIPAAFALVLLLNLSKFNRATVLTALIIFALMSPLGAGVAAILDEHALINSMFKTSILALVIGSFLHIATTILFETETQNHQISWTKLIAILVGLTFSLLTI